MSNNKKQKDHNNNRLVHQHHLNYLFTILLLSLQRSVIRTTIFHVPFLVCNSDMIFSFRDMATTQIIKTNGNDKKKDKYRENRKHIQARANSGNNTNIENLFVFAKNSDKQEQIRGTIPISKTFIFRIKQQRTGK